MSFALEKAEDVVEELVGFLKNHHSEVGALGEHEFSPDVGRYLEMDRLGYMRIYTVRLEGRLVGYCVLYILPHPHYSKMLWAQQDLLFIQKKYRGVRSYRFIDWVDEQLRGEGVEVVMRAATDLNDYGRLLNFMDYHKHSVNYIRRL